MAKKIVSATSDNKGRTKTVTLSGNKHPTPIKRAIKMAARGEIKGAHVVRPEKSEPYLRTNPDDTKGNNIDQLSGDK